MNTRKISLFIIITIILSAGLFWYVRAHRGKRNEFNYQHTYYYIKPDYDEVGLEMTGDSLYFPLKDNMYNEIKSFNIFRDRQGEFISFYDQRSQSINIFDLKTQALTKRIYLKQWFPKTHFYKTTAYVSTLDSIFVVNNTSLYLLDGRGKITDSVDFLDTPKYAWAFFDNTNPPVFTDDNVMYAGVRPNMNEKSLSDIGNWEVLYGFNLFRHKKELHYPLPEEYSKNYFGHHFLTSSYCYNRRQNFVFSFPADTVLYETNLKHRHVSYYAKSKFQQDAITPVSKEALEKDEGYKNYLTRDSYGPVYFDRHTRRYLRVAYSKISEADYDAKKRDRKQSLIILNESFKIIGQSPIDNRVMLNSVFFSRDGSMYARTRSEDEYALHFIRFKFTGEAVKQAIAKNEKNK